MKYIILLLTINLVSCQSLKITQNDDVDNEQIENQLLKQVKAGYLIEEVGLDGESNYSYGKEDYDVISLLIKNELRKNGYDFKSIKNKVSKIFNITPKDSLQSILVEWPCPKDQALYQLNFNGILSSYYPIQIDYINNFITDPLFIPELIDYKKQFPEILNIEKDIKTNYEGYKIIRWMDVEDLNKQRQKNIKLLVYRNMYLFKNKAETLDWLTENDEIFMRSLVLTFGWQEDEKLLKWVISNTPCKNNINEFKKLIYHKDCSENFMINKRVLEIMGKINPYIHSENFIYFIDFIINNEKQLELTLSEKSKTIAHLIDFILTFSSDKEAYRDLFMSIDYEYTLEFKKNNFYGINGLMEKWKNFQ